MQILIKNKFHWLIKNGKGKFQRIPAPKFYDGQIVKTSPEHFSQSDFIMLIDPYYNKERGWTYGNRYISQDQTKGGSSFSWKEEDFLPLDNPIDILYAERIYLSDKLIKINGEKRVLENKLEKIEYSLRLTEDIINNK